MKPIYIKKIGEKDGFVFWYVNGEYIRKNIEKDFVGYSDHIKYNFIPENEFWIEQEFGTIEKVYFIAYFLAKRKAIREGKSVKEAIEAGNIVEQEERNKVKIVQELKKLSKEKQLKKIHKKLLKSYSTKKIKVFLVNGFLVRSLYFLDFSQGGHHKVYDFIPENEIWIDDATDPKARELIIFHEAYERRLMSEDHKLNSMITTKIRPFDPTEKYELDKAIKESYDKAHALALIAENEFRKNPKGLKKKIKQEIKKQG